MKKMMEENVAAGRTPHAGMETLSDPATARRWAAWAADEPISKGFAEAMERGAPKWGKPQLKPGEWTEDMSFEDLLYLDPKINQKMNDISLIGSHSAKYAGPDVNHARHMAMGGEVEPIRVKLAWDDQTGALAVQDLDGLRRMMAARNMFGAVGSTKMPVVFEPLDETARRMSTKPGMKNTVHADVGIMMNDDQMFKAPGLEGVNYFEEAKKLRY
jgi:hypothetical protein